MGRLDKMPRFFRSSGSSRERTPVSDAPTSCDSSPSNPPRNIQPLAPSALSLSDPADEESKDKSELLIGQAAFNLCYVYVTRDKSYPGDPGSHRDRVRNALALEYARSDARCREARSTQCKEEPFLENIGRNFMDAMTNPKLRVLEPLCQDILKTIEKLQRVEYPELLGDMPSSPFLQWRNNTTETVGQALGAGRSRSSTSTNLTLSNRSPPIKTEDRPITPPTHGNYPSPSASVPPPVTPNRPRNDCKLCNKPFTPTRSKTTNENYRRPMLKCERCRINFHSWTDQIGIYDENPDCNCSPSARSRLGVSAAGKLYYNCAWRECRFYMQFEDEDGALLSRLRVDLARGRNNDWR